jgi:hypothetical protein
LQPVIAPETPATAPASPTVVAAGPSRPAPDVFPPIAGPVALHPGFWPSAAPPADGDHQPAGPETILPDIHRNAQQTGDADKTAIIQPRPSTASPLAETIPAMPIDLLAPAEPDHWPTQLSAAPPITPGSSATPAPVALQDLPRIAALALRDGPQQQIELRLDPPELGLVRFGLDHQAGGLVVTIIAERPDTVDLLRRHAEQFLADLRQTGFQGASLQFGTSGGFGGQGTERTPTPPPIQHSPAPATPSSLPAAAKPYLAAAGGLNLRL